MEDKKLNTSAGEASKTVSSLGEFLASDEEFFVEFIDAISEENDPEDIENLFI